ncbi:hypothetical protein Rhal01_02553 [Rubritalea halochordaticola]|uniref:Uncharacterized protein n=1 Tax=Rubritalea halochordaticola TaxID=714537 RepID=A0ABP9V300_9BACT
MRSYLLLTLAIFLFAIAQFLPAILPDMGAWNTPDNKAVTGWIVTALAWPFYVSNVALLLAPLLVILFKRLKRARAALVSLLVLYVLTPFATLLFREAILGFSIGFIFWVGSYCAAALGVAFALPPNDPAKQGVSGNGGQAH